MSNPIKPTFKTEVAPILFILISIVSSIYFYTVLPDSLATHWDIYGQPDGYSSRLFVSLFFPLLSMGIYFLLLFIPYLDPKKSNYNKFKNIYHILKGSLVTFIVLISFAVSFSGLGYNIPLNTVMPIGVGILFLIIGYYLENIQPNWFLGIRTPWTLSSDIVWKKTHIFGSKIFILVGAIFILLPLFYNWLIYFIILAFLLFSSIIIYSYWVYKK